MRFVLAHLPNIAHGTNSNFTILYHILRAEVWSDKTTSAAQLNINWDGGPENTDLTAMLFFCHLIHVGWRARICTHRMVRNHSHNMQDQNFYIIRYCGWRTTLYTTNLAMGLFKLLVGLKKCADSVVLLLVGDDYDWREYFKGCENKYFKHYTQPLAYQYEPGTAATGWVPAVKCKTWGHAEKEWRGVEDRVDGEPLRPYAKPPDPLRRPRRLPGVKWATEEIKKNVRLLAAKYCSPVEQKWFEVILRDGHLLNGEYLVWDGPEGEGGLPGRPGHFTCTDLALQEWTVKVRVLGPLPDDL